MILSMSVLLTFTKRTAGGKTVNCSNNYDTTGRVYHGFSNFLQGNSEKQILLGDVLRSVCTPPLCGTKVC